MIFPNDDIKECNWDYVFECLESEIKKRKYSLKTLKIYENWIRRFLLFSCCDDYKLLNQQNAIDFLNNLIFIDKASVYSQNQAYNALLFLYKNILGKGFSEIRKVKSKLKKKLNPYIPLVISKDEINLVFDYLDGQFNLICKLLYGCGLKLSECINLRVRCFDFEKCALTIFNDRKNEIDRVISLPESILDLLKLQMCEVTSLYNKDLEKKFFDGVFLFEDFYKDYEDYDMSVRMDLDWQWFFPQIELVLIPETYKYKRSHVHVSLVQKKIRIASSAANVKKRVTANTFRHSFACHLLENGCDVHTIQKIMGHKNINTTMIYTTIVNDNTLKMVDSPLDF